jgi:hypothetical protein
MSTIWNSNVSSSAVTPNKFLGVLTVKQSKWQTEFFPRRQDAKSQTTSIFRCWRYYPCWYACNHIMELVATDCTFKQLAVTRAGSEDIALSTIQNRIVDTFVTYCCAYQCRRVARIFTRKWKKFSIPKRNNDMLMPKEIEMLIHILVCIN